MLNHCDGILMAPVIVSWHQASVNGLTSRTFGLTDPCIELKSSTSGLRRDATSLCMLYSIYYTECLKKYPTLFLLLNTVTVPLAGNTIIIISMVDAVPPQLKYKQIQIRARRGIAKLSLLLAIVVRLERQRVLVQAYVKT
ncbi:hypothetical protein EVAR_57434_1 [Eumeta japonica]|uniref:Uncharacterized protein n=1 Tax=Eumeta variegata TaxID=151549 RepID=A0A4C1YEJ9_EUMVA|nr:hypothetical protein EVAR_57434_1 [Eumeta japonica]